MSTCQVGTKSSDPLTSAKYQGHLPTMSPMQTRSLSSSIARSREQNPTGNPPATRKVAERQTDRYSLSVERGRSSFSADLFSSCPFLSHLLLLFETQSIAVWNQFFQIDASNNQVVSAEDAAFPCSNPIYQTRSQPVGGDRRNAAPLNLKISACHQW